MNLLDGCVMVVTGGSSGIRQGIVLTYAEADADAVVCDIREEAKEDGALAHEQAELDTDLSATYVELDVTDPAAFEAAIDVAEAFGGGNVVVNNVDIWRPEEFLEVTEAEFQQITDINLKGVYFGAQAAAKWIVESGGGSIINVFSVNGIFGNGNYPSHSASKGAVWTPLYSLAHGPGGDGVRVNAIHPGATRTKIDPEGAEEAGEEQAVQLTAVIPLGRQGKPDDVAGVAVFLASDLSKRVTGESIVVDGGWTSWRRPRERRGAGSVVDAVGPARPRPVV